MIDADTIKICEIGQHFASEPDELTKEYRAHLADMMQIRKLRAWLRNRGMSTALDIGLNYQGRTYYTLDGHPQVRRKKRRMRELKTILNQRAEALAAGEKINPKTKHWFNRSAA